VLVNIVKVSVKILIVIVIFVKESEKKGNKMTVQELLDLVGGNQVIVIRYTNEVRVSDLTSGEEDVLVALNEDAVIKDGGAVILASDLCAGVK
jgi:hypothetical protein